MLSVITSIKGMQFSLSFSERTGRMRRDENKLAPFPQNRAEILVLITDLFRVSICSMSERSERPCESMEKTMLMVWGYLSLSTPVAHAGSQCGKGDVSILHSALTLVFLKLANYYLSKPYK